MRGTAKKSAGATSRMFSGTVSMLSAKFTVAPERSGLNTVKVRSATWQRGRNESCWSPSWSSDDEIRELELEQDVPVAQHRPLGGAGGAGGVDEDGEIVGLGDVHHGLEGAGVLLVVACAELHQLAERHHLGIAEPAEPLEVVDEDLHEGRTAVAHREDLVELLLVLGEEEARAAVVDDVLDLARRVRGVDAVGDAADGQRAEVRVEPLRAVVGDDRHHVARPEPQRHQPEPDVPGLEPVLPPGDRPPDPEVLLPHRHLVAALPHHVPEQPRQRVLPKDGAGVGVGRAARPAIGSG